MKSKSLVARVSGNGKVDADLGARVDASVDVKLQLVPILQLEAKASALLSQAAPVQDGIVLCLCLRLPVFVSRSSCLCLPVQNGNFVAQDLRLVHVVRRNQDRAVLLVLQHQVPNVPGSENISQSQR